MSDHFRRGELKLNREPVAGDTTRPVDPVDTARAPVAGSKRERAGGGADGDGDGVGGGGGGGGGGGSKQLLPAYAFVGTGDQRPGSGVRAWTENPNARLVKNARVIAALKRDVIALVAMLDKPNRNLMGEVGKIVEQLSGLHDFCFFEKLPHSGSAVVVLRALCPLYGKTLADGDDTLTGSFVNSFESALNMPVVRSNINMECLRKGDADGNELTGGSAGCCDPKGDELRVLADVKDLHYLCLRAAGVHVRGVIASSNGSIASFGVKPADAKHFVAYDVGGIYAGSQIFLTPHPKFASATCINNASVARRIGGSLGDPLSTPSRVLDGWANIGSRLLGFDADAAGKAAAKDIYERVREDPTSRATAREWDLRFSSTTTREKEARLKMELRKEKVKGGASSAFSAHAFKNAPENAHVPTHLQFAASPPDPHAPRNSHAVLLPPPSALPAPPAPLQTQAWCATSAPRDARTPAPASARATSTRMQPPRAVRFFWRAPRAALCTHCLQ